MRITGKLHSFGVLQIAVDVQQTDGWIAKQIRDVKGVLIECTDDAALRDASELFCATVDIYPHPVNELIKGECTPENYSHALARASATADHLAREVRSSQALLVINEGLRTMVDGYGNDARELREEVKRLRRVLHKHDISADTSGEEFDGMRDGTATLEAQHAALLAKQAEQERLLSIYRTKYHEADRALQQAHADLATAQYIAGKACQALAELSHVADDTGMEAQAIMCEWDKSGDSAGEHAARRVVNQFT